MYIKKINHINVGPIKNIKIDVGFKENGDPKPILLVGENGSGKSLFVSNIFDGFFEMAGKAYDNVLIYNDNNGYSYYKNINPLQISLGEKFLCSYISFVDDNEIDYIFKSGNISLEEFKQFNGMESKNIEWQDGNFKSININEKIAQKIYNENVICYFGPDRYEKPIWMGDKYYECYDSEHIVVNSRIAGKLRNPISVKNVYSANLQWILDVIIDSRPDIEAEGDGHVIKNVYVQDLDKLGKARKNLEYIISEILGKEVYFGLNFRNKGQDRFNIRSKDNGQIIIPSLNSLSTGQIALFNIFSTIVRYADNCDINKSFNLQDIKGIVVIDEIELHLHSSLQRDVLPRLIKLFPKVQFVITSHSPLFLLGMEEVFGRDNYEIYQMPEATKIDVECFSEFNRAYEYFSETQRYQKEIFEQLDKQKSKTLIVTEGATDWRHLKAAYNHLSVQEEYKDIFENLDFEFLEFDSKNSSSNNVKLEMGCSQLSAMCGSVSKLHQNRKIIFIADRDDKETNKKLDQNEGKYKNWGNNVYSILLPIPKHRTGCSEICIEHLYLDKDLKTSTEINGVECRLYMGNEFDYRGINSTLQIVCEKKNLCGKDKICIIDGSEKERVTKFNEPDRNIALPKMIFAMKILNKEEPYINFDFSSFIEVFKIIRDIINLSMV